MNMPATPLVVILMGSESDWETMRHCAQTLELLTAWSRWA